MERWNFSNLDSFKISFHRLNMRIVFLSRYQNTINRGAENFVKELSKGLSKSFNVEILSGQEADNLSKVRQNFENLDPSLKSKIEVAIPDTVALKSVIQTLEQTANLHEASVSALQIQPLLVETKVENQLGTLSEIAFTFNVEGEYQNLISILQDLKSSGRLISIDNLSISKLTEGPGLIMSLSGKAYYIK